MHRRLFISVSFAVLVVAASQAWVTNASAADPSVVGEWGDVMSWPDKAVHMTMLRTGKVLWYQGDEGATYIWDPNTLTHQSIPLADNIFCSGQSTLPDGRILVTGGNIDASQGPNHTFIFDAIDLNWTRGPDMRVGRYYPTHVPLADGTTLLIGGYDEFEVENPDIEIYVPAGGPGGTDRIDLVPGVTFIDQYYPRIHLLPDGRLFHIGKEAETKFLDLTVPSWTNGPVSNHGSRSDGTAVMLPTGHMEFMIMSGGTETVERINLDDPTPAWSFTPSLKHSRIHANNLILPTGEVLISGGENGDGFVYESELYDPDANTWTPVDTMHTWRVYHSSAVLLPDGRCLWAGADGNLTAEIYSPPYMFQGARPVIDSAPSAFEYGDNILVGTAQANDVTSACLIRLSAATHSVNMEQRYIHMPFQVEDANTLTLLAPNNPNEAPPGFYYLFILDDGVPSVAKIVNIGGDAAFSNRPPVVDAGQNQTVPFGADATLNGVVSDDGLPNPPGAVTVNWEKLTGPGSVIFDNDEALQTTASFSQLGTYELRLTADDDSLTTFDDVTIDVVDPATVRIFLKSRINSSSDDAEQLPNDDALTDNSDLEMVLSGGNQTVGLRFEGMNIPQGATIYSAFVQFMADESQSVPTTLYIHGEASGSPATFAPVLNDITNRPTTSSSVTWVPPAWSAGDSTAAQRTPDLVLVVQEIVDRLDWGSNAISLIISGTGHRTAESYDGLPAGAAYLCVEYGFGERENRAPIVDAGPNQVIDEGASAFMNGSATDDALPDPPNAMTHVWRQVSGPSAASFTDSTSLTTEVGFIDPGTYYLSLTSSDSELLASDTMWVRVRQGCPDPVPGGISLEHEVAPIIAEELIKSSIDDVEEADDGGVATSSGDLELVDDGGLQTVGLRFTDIDLPQGGIVTRAYIQFKADESQAVATSLNIQAYAADSAGVFQTSNGYVSGLPRTSASVTWNPPAWTAGDQGAAQKTPDLTDVIQELLDRPNWAGRSLAIIITGTGHRTAVGYDGDPLAAPRLFIEVGCYPNQKPSADAGPDIAVTMPAQGLLVGSVHDDGQPHPPDLVTATWAQVSGPGVATFLDHNSAYTAVTFSAPGQYVLSLTAYDGEYSVSDSCNVDVSGPVVNIAPNVDVGEDQAIDIGDVLVLAPTTSDDGLPNPPGAIVETWRQLSGPATVTFADSMSSDTEASFPVVGIYELSLSCYDGEYTTSDSMTVTVTDPCAQQGGTLTALVADPIIVDERIAADEDDTEERPGGSMSNSSSDLELVDDGGIQWVGLRWDNISIPQGSQITSAYIQFTADESQSEATSLTIRAVDADSMPSMPTTHSYLSTVSTTGASVTWDPASWTAGDQGSAQQTPDLSEIIQELVDRQDWSGRSLAIVITGTGHRTAVAHDGTPAEAARLYIEASECPPPPTSVEPDRPIHAVTQLGRVFPTPGPGPSTVQFRLSQASNVKLEVYDIRGALVRTIMNAHRGPGQHTTFWDGRDQSGRRLKYGMYLLRFAAAGRQDTRKLVIVR